MRALPGLTRTAPQPSVHVIERGKGEREQRSLNVKEQHAAWSHGACLVLFSVGLHRIWTTKPVLPRLWPCKVCLFGCLLQQSLDATRNCLVALICARTCIAALSCVHAHGSRELCCQKTDSKSVFREPGSGALVACPRTGSRTSTRNQTP
jgi:hypothetical protein